MIQGLTDPPPKGIRSDMGYELPREPIIKDLQVCSHQICNIALKSTDKIAIGERQRPYYDNVYEKNDTDFVRTKKRNATEEQQKWTKPFKTFGAGELNGIDEITESKEEHQHKYQRKYNKLVAEAKVKDREIEVRTHHHLPRTQHPDTQYRCLKRRSNDWRSTTRS
jgi:hypothetical protein